MGRVAGGSGQGDRSGVGVSGAVGNVGDYFQHNGLIFCLYIVLSISPEHSTLYRFVYNINQIVATSNGYFYVNQ